VTTADSIRDRLALAIDDWMRAAHETGSVDGNQLLDHHLLPVVRDQVAVHTCDGDLIECNHAAARGHAEADTGELRDRMATLERHPKAMSPPEHFMPLPPAYTTAIQNGLAQAQPLGSGGAQTHYARVLATTCDQLSSIDPSVTYLGVHARVALAQAVLRAQADLSDAASTDDTRVQTPRAPRTDPEAPTDSDLSALVKDAVEAWLTTDQPSAALSDALLASLRSQSPDTERIRRLLNTALALQPDTRLDTALSMAAQVRRWLDEEAGVSQRLREQNVAAHPLLRSATEERRRQIEKHGHTPQLDDRQDNNELPAAAAAYALGDAQQWPWTTSRPTNLDLRGRSLARAVALLMAEFDRDDRLHPGRAMRAMRFGPDMHATTRVHSESTASGHPTAAPEPIPSWMPMTSTPPDNPDNQQ